jgi:DNA-binding beta-propeller fold protein YncE
VRFLVTSAGSASGGYGAVLGFSREGELLGPFSADPGITDPRGLATDPSGTLIYVNSGEDRVLALDHQGNTVLDSGQIPGLDPGGATFGPDGRYYVGMRGARTIAAMPAALDGNREQVLPVGIVPFPRGFGFGRDGRLYLASGVGPSGEGDNTIVAFDRERVPRPRRLVTDAELSPLDLTVAANGNIVVASEFPFGTADAVTSVREYDPATGQLVRVFAPDSALEFRRPRGLRFGPDDHLYCVGEDHVVVFDFSTGDFLGPVVQLAALNGQALLLLGNS